MKIIQNISLRYANSLTDVDNDSHMSVTYLKNILDMAQKLHEAVDPNSDLEDWVDAKITIANEALSDVYTYLLKRHD